MKIIRAFSNDQSNTQCLQACVKSVLNYYFPTKFYSDDEVNKNTDYHNGCFSWSLRSIVWLNQLGLDTKIYSPFDYGELGKRGVAYLKEFKRDGAFELEQSRGEYRHIEEVQKASAEVVASGLWINKRMSVEDLESKLNDDNLLAIGKTVYEWLAGVPVVGSSHYVVVIKKYSPLVWRIMDPGLPVVEDRKVNQFIDGSPIFGDIILIDGMKVRAGLPQAQGTRQ